MAELEQSGPFMRGGIPLDQWSGAAATKELHATIKEFVQSSHDASRRMINLTWAIVVLTVVMVLAVGAQIALTLWRP
jgi:hypothetical protein